MSVHVHHDESDDRYELFLDLVLFRLSVPPLHLVVVESYPVHGV
jgi:hypothetical protein